MLESLLNLPDKSLWDVGEIFLAANKIIGSRETHRIVIRINKEIASPGVIEYQDVITLKWPRN